MNDDHIGAELIKPGGGVGQLLSILVKACNVEFGLLTSGFEIPCEKVKVHIA
jgi:hypothetical protein